ncbi:hypothetical protein CKY06_11215 [Photorhabdus sp. S15-56]|nr:hypothetical protein CKY14_10165 [Photorhabdus sp. S14-60]RAW75798.1 hypothetical protein CKY15_00050 [Photorhabdus sp. S7-51]RAW77594.1 hypothetical protein CKY06_11215 [Photorhabdus sp. S15-56]
MIGTSEHDQHTMIFFTTRLRKDGAINTGLNKIERLWQLLHETVTRNHCCQYMWQLLKLNMWKSS